MKKGENTSTGYHLKAITIIIAIFDKSLDYFTFEVFAEDNLTLSNDKIID